MYVCVVLTLHLPCAAACAVPCCVTCVQYGGFSDAPEASSNSSCSNSSSSCCAARAADGSSSKKPMVSIPQGHGDLCDVPASHIFPLGVMKFKGVPVSIPGDVPAVLRYRYGDNYMIPR